MCAEHVDIWQKHKVCKFLNMSYIEVCDMAIDEYIYALYLCEIEDLLKSEEGVQVLEDNIRYSTTDTDIKGLKKLKGGVKHG